MYQIGNIYFITAIAVIGGALFGFDIASLSAILGTQQYLCYFNQGGGTLEGEDCQGPNAGVQGGISAAMPGGSFLGALISGFLSDRYGRKTSVQLGCIIWVVGSIVTCAAQDIPMLVIGRFVNGLCIGIASAQVPVYVSEVAPPSKRGRVVGAQQWAITWGILIMYYIAYGCSFLDGSKAWRVPWGVQAVPAFVLGLGLFFTPESPRWLARKERWNDCHNVLALVHGQGDRHAPLVLTELQQIKDIVEFERRNADVSYLELIKPNMINRTHIGVFTQIWSQLTGMNVQMYYITYIFAMAGLTGNVGLYSSSIQYVINVLMTIPALLYADNWGRRPTLLIGCTLMTIFMYANGALMAIYGTPAPVGGLHGIPQESWEITGPASRGVIACTFLFVASFAVSVGPCSWIYPPELFPLRVRGKAVALSTSANWIFNMALSYFVPPAFVNIKWKVYILFGVFLTVMTIHIFFMFPETAGKSLEEVEDMFMSNTKAWQTRVEPSAIQSGESRAIHAEKRSSSARQKPDDKGETEEILAAETKV